MTTKEEALSTLWRLLAEEFSSRAQAVQLAEQSGLDLDSGETGDSPADIWWQILVEAHRRGKVDSLVLSADREAAEQSDNFWQAYEAYVCAIDEDIEPTSPPNGVQIETEGGAVVTGEVNADQFVGRDRIVEGDVVQGYKTSAGDISAGRDANIVVGDYTYVDQRSTGSSNSPKKPMQTLPRAEHFTGRETELAWLMRALLPGRTVTLCAAGGMGKTGLAAEALHWLTEDEASTVAAGAGEADRPPLGQLFPDGVVTHSFYGRPASDAAFQAILNAYDVDPHGDLAGAVYGLLASRTALIVLDGAEQADDLTAVRRAQPGTCGVLLTTRLNSQAPDPAWRRELHPLDAVQAVTLLREYAGEWAQPDDAAEAICGRVGYLPLALRIAGRYLAARMVTAAEYADDLDALGLRALEIDANHASDSVPKLLGVSVKPLGDDARAALGVAGLLALRSFDGDLVAAALSVNQAQGRRALGDLVDYGLLIRRVAHGRYDTGHALVHSYASTVLAVDDATAVRLAGYIQAQFRENAGDHYRLKGLRPHTVALLGHLGARGLWDAVDTLARPVEDYMDLQGHSADRQFVILSGLDAALKRRDRRGEGAWLGNMGLACADLGRVEEAIEYHEQALAIAQEIGDRRGEGAWLGNLGNTFRNLGQMEKAISYYEKALAISREIGDRRGEGNHLGNLGLAYADLGQVEKAIEYYEQALAIARKIDDRRGEAIRLGNLGLAYADLGQVEKAIEHHERALAIARQIGDRRGEGADLGNLGLAYADLGQVEKAIEHYEHSLAMARQIGDRRGEGIRLANLGLAYADLGQAVKAIGYYEPSLAIARQIGDRRGEGIRLGNLGLAYADLRQMEKAIGYYEQSLAIARQIGDRHSEAIALTNLGMAYIAVGQRKEAIQVHEQALAILEEIQSPYAETVRRRLDEVRQHGKE